MESGSLKQLYSTKSDDELLALGSEQESLTPDARSLLALELSRRGLWNRHHTTRVESDTALDLGENPAFNAAAKVGYILLAIFVFGSLALLLSMIISQDLNWKRELSMIALVMLLLWGPIFAAIVWATRWNLRNARSGPRKRKY